MNSAKMRILCSMASLLLLASCANNTRRNPALAQPADPGPEKKSLLARTADGTWNVVSAPVRWVTPNKKPQVSEQETFEPADAVIMSPTDASSPN